MMCLTKPEPKSPWKRVCNESPRGPEMDRRICECLLRREEEISAHRRAVKRWAEETKRLSGASGGFVPGPIYPVLPVFAPACERPCPSALASPEIH